MLYSVSSQLTFSSHTHYPKSLIQINNYPFFLQSSYSFILKLFNLRHHLSLSLLFTATLNSFIHYFIDQFCFVVASKLTITTTTMVDFKKYFTKNNLIGLGLGQFLSLLITATGFASSDLAKRGTHILIPLIRLY
jgi:hypothetical protein